MQRKGPTSFLQRLIEDIESQPKAELVLSTRARTERLAGLAAELLDLERQDEAIVMESEEIGPALLRRIDALPMSVLGFIVNTGAKQSAAKASASADRIR